MDEWIAVFKTGRHTDSTGNERDWSEKDLDTIVAKYNPAEHEAPVVIGHPKNTAPAWGWVEALKRQGEILYAKLKDLVPEFVEMVRQGLFKKRSIALYPDLSLQHVGFLGATPPAVKGLPDVNFKQGGGYLMYSEFETTTDPAELLNQRVMELMEKPYRDQQGERSLSHKEAVKIAMEENPGLPKQIAEARVAKWGY
jgi:hypothetical protein